jgi:4-hydroxybenzoate polyprenyltransferase
VHLKTSGIGAPLLHFGFGVAQLLIGATAVVGPDGATAAFAVFFAGLFVAGHWVHQVIDLDEDEAGNVTTTARVLGPQRTLLFARRVFVLSHAYVLALALAGVVEPWVAFIFALPMPTHLRAAWVARRQTTTFSAEARAYRLSYRLLFGLATILYVGLAA